jgi:GntR family transcriptional regulator
MRLELDFRSKVPIYAQLVEQVGNLVATGVLKPGDQLPTVRQLAADLRVNFNTIARAYRMLDEAGVISTQQGRGTFLLERLPPPKAKSLKQAALRGLTSSYLNDAARLGFGPDEIFESTKTMIEQWQRDGVPPDDREPRGR